MVKNYRDRFCLSLTLLSGWVLVKGREFLLWFFSCFCVIRHYLYSLCTLVYHCGVFFFYYILMNLVLCFK